MKIMEKKRYNKPEVKHTKIDFSITLTLGSNDVTPNNSPGVDNNPDGIPVNAPFINPFKWFR